MSVFLPIRFRDMQSLNFLYVYYSYTCVTITGVWSDWMFSLLKYKSKTVMKVRGQFLYYLILYRLIHTLFTAHGLVIRTGSAVYLNNTTFVHSLSDNTVGLLMSDNARSWNIDSVRSVRFWTFAKQIKYRTFSVNPLQVYMN